MNTPFVWMVAYQTALGTIKYPDPSKEYHWFMDASNHTWSSVLTQQRFNSEINHNEENTYHPIMYQSTTFSTSQLKWLATVKKCYMITMSFHKMAFYL